MSDDAIVRELERLRVDIKEDFADLRGQLAALLPREVYSAHHDAVKTRLDKVEREMVDMETKRVATRRWIITAIVVPSVMMMLTILLTVWGPR